MRIEDLYEIYKKHPVICTDTRKLTPGCLFFALKGPSFNANTLAQEAIEKGAAFACIDEVRFKKGPEYLLTDDVLQTLQQLAKHHRRQLQIPVIAIVGSNGKTTTKELITAVLKTEKKVWATPGNFNNHIGLPLTLLMLTPEHDLAVIEMGANHVGENAFLCELAEPNSGLITNNGKDHLEGFGSMEGVLRSNSELYAYLQKHQGMAFVNANDAWLVQMAGRLSNKLFYAAHHSGIATPADITGKASRLQPEIEFELSDTGTRIQSCLSGDYNFDNIMAAVCVGRYYGISDRGIQQGIAGYVPKNNRSQVIQKTHNTLFMDAYNANPSSMEAALKNFAAMPYPHRVAILGDMFELGTYEAEEHRNLISFCETLNLEQVYFVGPAFEKQKKASDRFFFYKTLQELAEYLNQHPLKDKQIFLKGSRGIQLEKVAELID